MTNDGVSDVLQNSPYAQTLPRIVPKANAQGDALGYSRHYAKKIRNMGKTSKESWIKRLWNHMFSPPKKGSNEEEEVKISRTGSNKETSTNNNKITVSNNNSTSNNNSKNKGAVSKDLIRSSSDSDIRMSKVQDEKPANQVQTLSSHSAEPTQKNSLSNSPYIPAKERAIMKMEARNKSRWSSPNAGKERLFYPKPVHPYLSQQETWKPSITRRSNVIQLEKQAKEMAEKATKNNKVFTCVGPYPVDVYVRYSLRKRGWVEKFNLQNMSVSKGITSGKLRCEKEEDFEAICDCEIPAPWDEGHGIYSIVSRLVRHVPPRFIWGNKNVNTLVLKSEVIVNHFPKARHFASKILITNSLKELAWVNHSDWTSFFPRCYVLNSEEKDDMIDDYRLTACMAILKWVYRRYTTKQKQGEQTPIWRENTKYEEVTFKEETGNKTGKTMFLDSYEEKIVQSSNCESANNSGNTNNVENSDHKDTTGVQQEETSCREPSAVKGEIISNLDNISHQDNELSDEEVSLGPDNTNEEEVDDFGEDEVQSGNKEAQKQVTFQTPKGKLSVEKKAVPNFNKKAKKGGQVSIKALEWALTHCHRYIQFRNHKDIDSKKRGLSPAQWESLLEWYLQIVNDGAEVPVTESLLKQSEETLKKLKKLQPQYDIDGLRNIWIIKPGDKSKGVGIEFCEKLDEILKYVDNATTQGTYVAQKYIERPLLVHRTKFDIRQWFLVTDWNPLTVWVYKESYLRFCSQEYSYDTMHESVHLSNVAIQQFYFNGKRSSKLPEDNFWTSSQLKEHLVEVGAGEAWDEIIYPGMKAAIVNTLRSTQDITENRKSGFELYGADFMLSEDYSPWLLEINSCPGMAPHSVDKVKLCATVIDDTIKVVLDRRENRNCSTGKFELAFQDQVVSAPKCVDLNFKLEGARISKSDLQKYNLIDRKFTKKEESKYKKDEKPQTARPEDETKENNEQKETETNETSNKENNTGNNSLSSRLAKPERGGKADQKTTNSNKKGDKLKSTLENSPYNTKISTTNKNKDVKSAR